MGKTTSSDQRIFVQSRSELFAELLRGVVSLLGDESDIARPSRSHVASKLHFHTMRRYQQKQGWNPLIFRLAVYTQRVRIE